jgi:CRISPR/Cas system CMR subunit Cmr4 (Cas7 group RAMP superfamily)
VVAVRFEITFFTPFRVASGHAGRGVDSTVDRALLLPASSLKGLMRSAARDLLGVPGQWVNQVYGTGWHPSPWSWSDATLAGNPSDLVRPRARVQIAPDTSTVVEGALAVAEEVLAERGEFTVEATGWVTPAERERHEAVLTASARAVTTIGGDRRRGLGWVCVTPIAPAWPSEPEQAAVHAARLVEELFALGEPA